MCGVTTLLELNWREIAQRGMHTFVHVDLVEKAADLSVSIMIAIVFKQIHLLLFDCAQEALGETVLSRLLHIGHANLNTMRLQPLSVGGGSILHALVGMMHLRLMLLQGFVQRGQREILLRA